MVNHVFQAKSIMKKLRKSCRIGRFIRISLSAFIIIVSVVLNPLNLLSSYAYSSSIPVVNSPIPRPSPSFESYSNFEFYIFGYFTDGRGYQVGHFVLTGLDSSSKFTVKNGFIRANKSFSLSFDVFDIETGDLLNHQVNPPLNNFSPPVDSYFSYSYGSIFAQNTCTGLFYILPSFPDDFYVPLGGPYSNEFVDWGISAPEPILLTSTISEPVSDKYNRYFVVDDKLYWLSIQLNGFYIEKSVFENTTVVVPDYEFAGDETVHDSQNGTYYHVWQEFNGKQYIPVSLSTGRFSDDLPFYLTLIPGTSSIQIFLEPYSFIEAPSGSAYPYFLQSSFFLSEFNLEDGSYITSSFTEINQEISLTHYLNLSVDSGSSVRCYGVNWFNNQNLPYNLASVLWGHDPVFAEWRDQMLIKLTQIYNVLSGSDEEPVVPTYPNYGGEVASGEPSFSDVSPDSVKVELSKAADSINGYSGVAATVRSWISDFMPTKLVVLIIFALSFGVVLLILGKNKDD